MKKFDPKKALQIFLRFLAGSGGLVIGAIAMKQIEQMAPQIPGLVKGSAATIIGIALAIALKNKFAQAGTMGLGMAGALDLIQELTANAQSGPLAMLNQAIPLSGIDPSLQLGQDPSDQQLMLEQGSSLLQGGSDLGQGDDMEDLQAIASDFLQ